MGRTSFAGVSSFGRGVAVPLCWFFACVSCQVTYVIDRILLSFLVALPCRPSRRCVAPPAPLAAQVSSANLAPGLPHVAFEHTTPTPAYSLGRARAERSGNSSSALTIIFFRAS